MIRTRTVAAVSLPLLAGACHHYVPGSLVELDPGDRVRTLLTQEQIEEFDEFLPRGERALEGTVVDAGAEAAFERLTTTIRRSHNQLPALLVGAARQCRRRFPARVERRRRPR